MSPERPGEAERGGSITDSQLVAAARRGDKRAFVEIVARHQAMVCGIALGILGDFAASEDAGQEAFLTAWRKFHELREPERLRGWLAQIARNAALGQLRRRREHGVLDDVLAVPDEAPRPDEAAASEEEAALVRAALGKLPENLRLPLVLYYREGKSVSAVAETLGLSEDAVKQRLSRGREMLRERMSGVVETVLTRTGPTAIFTMAVAVAIGALATPAAMAGTAFAAASIGSTTTAATSSTPILTAMSTTKGLLVAAAVVAVLCVPLGYQLSSSGVGEAGTTNIAQTQPVAAPALSNSAPTFEGSALFAEWRALHTQFGTNASAMPAIFKAIGDIKDPFRRQAFRTALISEWVQVDPAGGMKFMLGKGPDSTQRKQFFQEWLARDARGAVSGLMTAGSGWENLARDCLADIARQVPSAVPEIASRLPKADSYWDTSVREAFVILSEGGLDSARKAAEGIGGASREQALSGVALAWAKSDVNGAIAWAKSLPDGTDREEIIRAALLGKAAVDPAGALDLVGTVPSGGRYSYFGTSTGARVLAAAGKANFDATVAWVAAHPGQLGRDDLYGLSQEATDRLNADAAGFLTAHAADGTLSALMPAISHSLINNAGGQRAEIWDWLKTQPDSGPTAVLRQDVLRSAGYQDPELALQWVADLPNTPEGDSLIKDLARALFNGGHLLHRFGTLLPEAPDRLRQPLTEAAFGFLTSDNLGDPSQWTAAVSGLPEAGRAKGADSLAKAWTQQAPEDAAAWANSLSAGDLRNNAMATIASTWAAKDAQGAADWVTSLGPGTARDQSTEALVMAAGQQHPKEAWEWALSIGDSTERNQAASYAANMMAVRDPATARQWIESGPFSPETKIQLESALKPAGGPTGRH